MRRFVSPAPLALLLGLVAAGCSSVDLPQEAYYRITLPAIGPIPVRSAHVLRVEGFELDSSLSSDRLLVAETPVRLRAYEFQRWVNPLDRLVQDALQRGLTHTRAFAEATVSEVGRAGLLEAARALALTVLELVRSPKLRDDIRGAAAKPDPDTPG